MGHPNADAVSWGHIVKHSPVVDLENIRMEIKSLCAAVARINCRLDELTGDNSERPQAYPSAGPQTYPDGNELGWRAKILALTAEAAVISGVDMTDILGRSQTAGPVTARQWVYYEANQSGIPFAAIGRIMGRDHTTIMSGAAKEANRRGPMPAFKSVRAK